MSGVVLIVDDSLTVRMDLTQAFAAAGFVPLPCASAAEARAALEREHVALMVLDVILPDGDGIDLLKAAREAPASAGMPILMLSTEAEVADRIRGLRTGADDYVGKPYDTSYVIARARELLRGREGPDPKGQATVLVIDDSPTFREELRGALERSGFTVATAASGEEGLRLAATSRPDAIIVDGMLPGIDGETVIRRVRLDAALRGTPCVLLTASDDRGAELRALDAGADAFVRKEEDFEVILARLATALRGPGTERSAAASLMGPKRILAVDDSATYLQELAAMLRDEGYDVVLARSGEEAIDMLGAQLVDCILLDVIMPGLGGKATCRRIKSSPSLRDIPLILLTALDDRDAMIDGLSTGADDYISKSSEVEMLKARVRAQIRRKQFEDENRRVREDLLRSELEAAEARAATRVAEAKAILAEELERKNKELEAFSYSVSHDLRAPLRSIDGFSRALLDDCAGALDDKGRGYLRRIREGAQRMGELIDDILELSRFSRVGLNRERVDLSKVAREVSDDLARKEPERRVETAIQEGLIVKGDRGLLRILLENLLGNAWKFTSKNAESRIEVGAAEREGSTVYFVRDNGAGFDMAYMHKLFAPFQRLHSEADFPGSGIGLATVYRIVERHGGRVWAEGAVGRGATVTFTLPAPPVRPQAVLPAPVVRGADGDPEDGKGVRLPQRRAGQCDGAPVLAADREAGSR